MTIDPKKLEEEADALLKAANEPPPPENADTAGTDDEGQPVEGAAKGAEGDGNQPGSEATSESQPAAPASADTDELHGLSLENAQERIRNAQARMTRATQEAADLRRSVSELQRQINDLSSRQAATGSDANETSRPEGDTGASKGALTSLEALREEYPTIMEPLLAELTSVRARLDAIDSERTTEKVSKAQEAQNTHINTILQAHPDLYQIVETDDFKGWLDRQPKSYSIYLYGDGIETSRYRAGGNAGEIIGVLNDYKKAIGHAKKTAKAKESATPSMQQVRGQQPSTAKKTWTQEQIKAMSPAEYAANEAEIDLAMAEGRIT